MDSVLASLDPNQYALLVSLVAIVIAEDLTPLENASLGNFITSVGEVMLVIAAQQVLVEEYQRNTQQ